jgi:hypothetical protein
MIDPMRKSNPNSLRCTVLALAGVMVLGACSSDTPAEPEITEPEITFSASGEGCAFEFWRTEENLQLWPEGRPPTHSAGEYFPELTYLDVLWLDGGGLNALGREAVAGILNAAHPEVEYGVTASQVRGAFMQAAASGEYESLKNVLEALNRRNCPLD